MSHGGSVNGSFCVRIMQIRAAYWRLSLRKATSPVTLVFSPGQRLISGCAFSRRIWRLRRPCSRWTKGQQSMGSPNSVTSQVCNHAHMSVFIQSYYFSCLFASVLLISLIMEFSPDVLNVSDGSLFLCRGRVSLTVPESSPEPVESPAAHETSTTSQQCGTTQLGLERAWGC